MSRATLVDVLTPALREGRAVAGLVVLGWEDARAFVEAAEAENVPVILQAGPGCRKHTPVPILAKMFLTLADRASVPVVAHLDHGTTRAECEEALNEGFTSVMFDGSRLSLDANIAQTAEIVALAHAVGASCEGEIGFVGYAEGEPGAVTDPAEAARFARETGVDAMAISIGNVHLQQEKAAQIDFDALAAIEAVTRVPLVLHGGSGIDAIVRAKLARDTHVCKFNIGTELRMAFGEGLRRTLSDNPNEFDRIKILSGAMAAQVAATRSILTSLYYPHAH